MKITIETDGRKISAEIADDVDIYDVIDIICGILVAYGFHPSSVERGIIQQAELYEQTNDISIKP